MKTADLIFTALDWAVARAEGRTSRYKPHFVTLSSIKVLSDWDDAEEFSPSTNWAQGGPIIEREGIFPELTDVDRHNNGSCSFTKLFQARTPAQVLDDDSGVFGPTPLIAAMRCFVSSKLGDEIDIPKELL